MKLSCPHCSQPLELTPDVLASLQGQPHFECPSCQGLIAVPAQPQRPMPRRPQPQMSAAASQAQRGQNRNVLVLGIVALLVLGGIAAFLASRNSGSITNIFQNTTNNIIHNNYFTQLIANGATTMEDLKSIEEIRPYGDGFIGISKAQLNWDEAQKLAKRTGSEVLEVEAIPEGGRQKLLDWLAESFISHLSSSVWVSEFGKARILDGSEVLAVTAMDRQRKVVLHWRMTSTEPKTLEEALLNYRWEWTHAPKPPDQLTFHKDGIASCPRFSWHWKITGPQTAIAFDSTSNGKQNPSFKATLNFDANFKTLEAATDDGMFHYTGRRLEALGASAFIDLFDAANLDGWKQSGEGGIKIQDGVGTTWFPAGGGFFGVPWYSKRTFSDFILSVEFRATQPEFNSGLRLRFTDPGNDPMRVSAEGNEIAICDDGDNSTGKNPTGSIFGQQATTPTPLKPLGEWNTLEVSAIGQNYIVTLNGQVVNRFTGSRLTEGYIGLENHKRGSVQFRNVRIKDLKAGPSANNSNPTDAALKIAANEAGFESLFNGRDLAGWSGDQRFWSVREGVITGESPPNDRVPTDTYLIWQGGDVADFELRLSYKTTAGNSGVNYRSKVLDPAAWLVGGYQFEIDADRLPTNGGLYEDRGHRKAFAHPGAEFMANPGEKVQWSREGARTVVGNLGTKASVHSGDWNELIIICRGNHLIHQLNGVTTIDLTDDEVSAKATSGVLALQLHSGSPQKVQFKDIRLKRL